MNDGNWPMPATRGGAPVVPDKGKCGRALRAQFTPGKVGNAPPLSAMRRRRTASSKPGGFGHRGGQSHHRDWDLSLLTRHAYLARMRLFFGLCSSSHKPSSSMSGGT
jgi:hypothetical protein